MNSSKEDLIEMADLTSPTKSTNKIKKRNKVDMSPTNSVSTTSRANIINMFSVKTQDDIDTVSQTVSDISDATFIIEKSENNPPNGSKTYKDKISKHLRNIKQRASSSHKLKYSKGSKTSIPLERIRKESEDLDADVLSVKEKFRHKRKLALEKRSFFFGVGDKKQDNETLHVNESDKEPEKVSTKSSGYSLPEQLAFNIELSEKENCVVFTGKSVARKTEAPQNSSDENVSQGTKKHINLLEKRLLSVNHQRWFDSAGNLSCLENPLRDNAIRQPSVKYNDNQILSYKPATAKEDCNEIVTVRDNILELYLEQLKFKFHPLFSIEHYFAQKLKCLYEQYNYEKENLEQLNTQLDNLRALRDREKSKKEINSYDNTSKINRDIKRVRNNYFEEAKRNRDNLKCILETWKTIKQIRENQKYSTTSVKLMIKKEKPDCNLENEERKMMFDKILVEILDEKMLALNRKSGKTSDESDHTESELSSTNNTSSYIDEEKVARELQKKFLHSFRTPGEPILVILLNRENKITNNIENYKETLRRNAVISTKIYFRILCGKIEVCKSTPVTLNEEFCLDIDKTFSIQLVDIPEYLTFEVYEQHMGLLKKKTCEMEIRLPSRNTSLKNSKSHKQSFIKNEIVHYKHEGIGSGVDLKAILEEKNLKCVKENRKLHTSGYLLYHIGWEKVFRGEKVNCQQSQLNSIIEVTDKNMAIDFEKLEEWLRQTPNYKEQSGDGMFKEFGEGYDQTLHKNRSKLFRLNPYENAMRFCDISEIDRNIRLQILRLRNQHEVEFDGMTVPNRIKEIPFNILAGYKRRIASEKEPSYDEDDDDNEIETQRNLGKKYLRQVHLKIFQKCKNSDNNLAYESVVNEKYLTYFELMVRTLTKNFINWFRWQPKINEPLPIKTKEENGHKADYNVQNQVNITVKVGNGRNIPNRSIRQHNIHDSQNDIKTDSHLASEVRPFVEIAYENISVRTSTTKGTSPAWNETLALPLESLHSDYLNPSSLNGSITVNLYDEKDSEIRNINRKSCTWLGGIEISLSAICCSNGMEGLFKLKSPQMLFGYETELEKYRTKSPKASNLQSHLLDTVLQMEFQVQPSVPKLTPNMEELPCSEVPYLQDYIIKWNQTYNNSFPHRKFSALAIDTNAKTTCITRYIKALEPPQINLDEFDVTAEQCFRYVSLIPFTECNRFYQNVWLTTDQLLRFMTGSIVDHAITLVCYLLALKMDVWLLLGYGIPHGSTAYVLICEYGKEIETQNYYVYDVLQNEKYNIMDGSCPLQKIYCMVNGENIWANVQRNDNINLTRFDLSRRSDWLPLFTNNVNAPTHYINTRVSYHQGNATDLEMQLERKIRKKISKLRQLDRTVWNNHLGNTFKNILKSFEVNYMYNKNHYETLTEVNKELSLYDVSGYILNTAFSSTSTILRKIKSLGIHVQEDKNINFALAVHIQAYPGQLLSVWILIVNIRKKN